jgi:hypothetical protein
MAMVNDKSVQEIIDCLEKFNSNYAKQIPAEYYKVFYQCSKFAARDILNLRSIEGKDNEIEKTIQHHSNTIFLLGYGFGIKNFDNHLDFGDEAVKDLGGEQLYIYINNINKLIAKFVHLKINEMPRSESIQVILKIIDIYLEKIFVAGYMTGCVKENNINHDKNSSLIN